MERSKQIVAVAAVVAILGTTAAWLFRTPETRAVILPPVNSLHH
jgi:hypothetical protein